MERIKNYKPSKKDLRLLSASTNIGLRVAAMPRKRSDGEVRLQMDVTWPREETLLLGDIIDPKELAYEHIRLYRKYYAMIYNHQSIHYKKPKEQKVEVVKTEPKKQVNFKF